MSKTIFLAVPGHAKFKIRIGELGRATGGAPVERLVVAPGLNFETLAAASDFFSLSHVLENLRPEEEEVIRERQNHRKAICIGSDSETKEEKGTRDPPKPLDLHGQDKHHVD